MKRMTWMLGAYLLGACGSASASRFGTFVRHEPGLLQALAADATEKIAFELPAEGVALRLFDEGAAGLSAALATALRRAGYRVHSSAQPAPQGQGQPLNLGYGVDYLGSSRVVRLSLEVGRIRLGRVYEIGADGVAPLGPWSRADLQHRRRRHE